MKGKVRMRQTVPKTCHALRLPNFRQRKKLSPASEKYPTKTVEMPSAIWPANRMTPAYVLSNWRTYDEKKRLTLVLPKEPKHQNTKIRNDILSPV